MRPDRQVATWPFLLILAALFVVSVMAPRSWEKAARPTSVAKAPAAKAKPAAEQAMHGVALARRRTEKATPALVELPLKASRDAEVEPSSWPHHDGEYVDIESGFAVELPAIELAIDSPEPPLRNRQELLAQEALARLETLAERVRLDVSTAVSRITWNWSQAKSASRAVLKSAANRVTARWREWAATLAAPQPQPLAANVTVPVATEEAPFCDADDSLQAPVASQAEEPEPAEPPASHAPSVRPVVEPLVREPFTLVRELEQLSLECRAGEWPMQALAAVRALTAPYALADGETDRLLAELSTLASPDHPALAVLGQDSLAIEVRRAQHALARRVRLWKKVLADQTATQDLLDRMEAYESTGLPRDARRLAEARGSGTSGGQPNDPAWEQWFRNANIRLSVTARLLNRLLPYVEPVTSPVSERILGVPTRGVSTATTQLRVAFLPGEDRIRLVLRAFGDVDADTRSRRGPATVFTHSNSTYQAERLIEIGPHSWTSVPTTVDASSRPRLRGIRTDFDEIPVVGTLVQEVVRHKFGESYDEARREGERRIVRQVSSRFDGDLDRRLRRLDASLDEHMRATFKRMHLEPEILEMNSDPQGMMLRARLADHDQLAANTPRPEPPSDSLASLQIHQTAINNLLERLNLEGRTFALPELYELLSERLAQPIEPPDEVLDTDIEVTFAKENPLVVQFLQGRLELILSLAELRHEDKTWRNLEVRVGYKPEVTLSEARLIREGSIVLSGKNIRGMQWDLRSIFNKAFSVNKPLKLAQGRLTANPRFHDLCINHCQMIDGWMSVGLAEMPKTAAAAARTAVR